jgi:hypothetical protein
MKIFHKWRGNGDFAHRSEFGKSRSAEGGQVGVSKLGHVASILHPVIVTILGLATRSQLVPLFDIFSLTYSVQAPAPTTKHACYLKNIPIDFLVFQPNLRLTLILSYLATRSCI